ncbi:MAG: hydrogenase nickel incorporation protein HypB [Lachnospiraceae bacterium]|nr:hydrogenase nickel incorporation protein HypB [Lachnospiraceae bacterium]
MNVEIFETKERLLADNDSEAEKTRLKLRENGTFFVNLMGSPGAGKTSVLLRLLPLLSDSCRIGVMEADVDSDVDAKTIAGTGTKVIQLHTGGLCHMDADMTSRALQRFGTDGLDLIFLENIGNLVCPAEFDVGADLRLMILSVPEGDDKPLKYPLMFTVSDVLLVNKTDTAPIFDFDMDRLTSHVHALNPEMKIFPVSAKTGEGFEAVASYLESRIQERRNGR